MAPKVAAKKAAAKSRPAAAPAGSEGGPEERWLRAQIAALEAQQSAIPWLEEPHSWHQERLQEVLERFQQGSLASLPSELRDGIEFYVSQCADGQDVSQESFYDDRDLYKDVLAAPKKAEEAAYVRAPDSPEALQAIEAVGQLADGSPHTVLKLAKLLKAHEASAGVHVAGLARLTSLLGELRGAAPGATAQGLLVPSVFPIVEASLGLFLRDAEVQRLGCGILRIFGAADWARSAVIERGGAELAVRAARTHMADAEVVRSGVAVIAVMVNGSAKNSPEWARLRSSGAAELMPDVTLHHAMDVRLDKVARQTLPFLRG